MEKGWGWGKTASEASEKRSGADPMTTQPVPGSTKTVPQLAKVEPISDIGAASVIIYLRKDKGH